MPEWVGDVVWWQVYPLGFLGAPARQPRDGTVVHRLPHLERWLGYAAELGASGLALGPIFASESHGYDTVDHFRIDARLGDLGDFGSLVEAAHDRGLRVLLDGVFNHVGRGFPAFSEVLAQGPAARRANWFDLSWPSGWQPGAEPGYRCFEGHHHLVALNHGSPEVADYVTDVMFHWLGRGADGWRLDAAYAVAAAFWAKVLPRVRAAFPEAYSVGEVIHGDYAEVVRASGLDAVTQYELWKATWSSLNDANFFELAWALDRHNRYLGTFAPLTFVGNHDVTRLASKLTDSRHLAHAIAVLLTTGGTPSIYYGDEQAFEGVKEDRPGGDDAVRPQFPSTVPELGSSGWPTYRLYRDLVSVRRQHPWLYTARTQVVTLTNCQLVYHATHEAHRLSVALNVAGSEANLDVDDAGRRVLAGGAGAHMNGRHLIVPPHGWAIVG